MAADAREREIPMEQKQHFDIDVPLDQIHDLLARGSVTIEGDGFVATLKRDEDANVDPDTEYKAIAHKSIIKIGEE